MLTKPPLRPSRGILLLMAVLMIAGLGLLIQHLPGDWTLTTAPQKQPQPQTLSAAKPRPNRIEQPQFDSTLWRQELLVSDTGDSNTRVQRQEQIRVLFEHGVNLLQQHQYSQARRALELVIETAPTMPEAHVNLGFVLYELQHSEDALRAFSTAIELNPYQNNAYYGTALVYERLGDYQAALGHMRSFIHLSPPEQPFLTKARAALWEWEQILARRQQPATPGGQALSTLPEGETAPAEETPDAQ